MSTEAQERDGLAGPAARRLYVGVVVVFVLALLAAAWLTVATGGTLHRAAALPPTSAEIGGVEQTNIRRDRRGLRLRESQRRELEEYQWVSRERGIVRLPIQRAMERVVQEQHP